MSEQLKTVKEVFPDFENNTQITNLKIKNVNLYKKTNILKQDLLMKDNEIELKSIYLLEKYLKNRFNVSEVELKIYSNVEYNILTKWNNIVNYINIKYPLTKAILINSSIELQQDNKILIKLAVKGEDFLIASGFDKIIEKAISNFYNQD